MVVTSTAVVLIQSCINADRRIAALCHVHNAFALASIAHLVASAGIAAGAAVGLVVVKVGADAGYTLFTKKTLTLAVTANEAVGGVACVETHTAMLVAGVEIDAIDTTLNVRRKAVATHSGDADCIRTGVTTYATVVGIGQRVHTGAATFLHRTEAGAGSVVADLVGAAGVVAGTAVSFVDT